MVNESGDDQLDYAGGDAARDTDKYHDNGEDKDKGDGLGKRGSGESDGYAFGKMVCHPATEHQSCNGGDFKNEPVFEAAVAEPANEHEDDEVDNGHGYRVCRMRCVRGCANMKSFNGLLSDVSTFWLLPRQASLPS